MSRRAWIVVCASIFLLAAVCVAGMLGVDVVSPLARTGLFCSAGC